MIRARAALMRQVQEFFRLHLLGIASWDDVRIRPPQKIERAEPSLNARGRRRRSERPEGKFHQALELEFGIWRLMVESPNEHPPLGWIRLDAHETIEGPLDEATWKRCGEHIRHQHEEFSDVA